MNTPNKLTVLRILLVFPAVLFVLYTHIPGRWLFTFLIFAFASYTDYLDGKIARKYNFITDFGKIMDPLADKILVISMLICFVGLKLSPVLPVVFIVIREFTVTSVRFLLLKTGGKVVPANIWGKLKTVSQIIAINAVIIFQMYIEITGNKLGVIFTAISYLLIWLSAVFSLISGVIYIWGNRKFLN